MAEGVVIVVRLVFYAFSVLLWLGLVLYVGKVMLGVVCGLFLGVLLFRGNPNVRV